MRKRIVILLAAIVLILALGIQVGLSKGKEEAALDTSKIMRKLNEVLANQAEMFKQFDEIKQELVVIKVRASR